MKAEQHFEALFAARPDPWGSDILWYEQRKRAALLASLPRVRFVRAYEPACGNGALTEALAPRCDHLLASDSSPSAVALARARVAQLLEQVEASLGPGGTLVACHWNHPAGDRIQPTPTVHQRLGANPRLHRLVHHQERDFLLDVWCRDPRSVAQLEGLA